MNIVPWYPPGRGAGGQPGEEAGGAEGGLRTHPESVGGPAGG